jgi:hypothetical protein
MSDYPVERLYRDTRLGEIGEGIRIAQVANLRHSDPPHDYCPESPVGREPSLVHLFCAIGSEVINRGL